MTKDRTTNAHKCPQPQNFLSKSPPHQAGYANSRLCVFCAILLPMCHAKTLRLCLVYVSVCAAFPVCDRSSVVAIIGKEL